MGDDFVLTMEELRRRKAGGAVTAAEEASVVVPVPTAPALVVEMEAEPAAEAPADAGLESAAGSE